MQDHMSESAAMRRAAMLGYDEELRLTLAEDGTYGVLAYRDSYNGITFTCPVDVREDGSMVCEYSLYTIHGADAESLLRAFARKTHRFGRLVVARRGVDKILEITV